MTTLRSVFFALLLAAASAAANAQDVTVDAQTLQIVEDATPVYPPLAKAARVQGTVRFRVRIGADGAIVENQLVSGHPLLVDAAREALHKRRYRPVLLNGSPVVATSTVDIVFRLDPGPAMPLADWTISWQVLRKYRKTGEGAPPEGMFKVLASGLIDSPDPRWRGWTFQPLSIDSAAIEPNVAVSNRPAVPDVEVTAKWAVLESRQIAGPRASELENVAVSIVVGKDGAVSRVIAIGTASTDQQQRLASQIKAMQFRPVAINGEAVVVQSLIPGAEALKPN